MQPINIDMELKNIFIDNSPAGYIPSNELVHAAEVAYALKRPLLLSGEPGTGKTEFARWVADTLSKKYGFNKDPLVFPTKSTSIAQDLFYYYDAISHFRDANIQRFNNESELTHLRKYSPEPESELTDIKKVVERRSGPVDASDYITFNALGLAFQRAKGLSSGLVDEAEEKSNREGTVVLIDEIDKAPRDFPNDLLNEIERYTFEIRELNHLQVNLSDEEKKKIFVIMTSNFEKNLPEAFLRRCVYFHISFPTPEKLTEILKKRLNISDEADIDNIRRRVEDFFRFRADDNIQKKPSTSEALDFVRVLYHEKKLATALFDGGNKITREGEKYISLLLKKREDRDLYIAAQA
jgi:MoxR-like ATPase